MFFAVLCFAQLSILALQHFQPLLLILSSRDVLLPAVRDILAPVPIGRKRALVVLHLAAEISVQVEDFLPVTVQIPVPDTRKLRFGFYDVLRFGLLLLLLTLDEGLEEFGSNLHQCSFEVVGGGFFLGH